MRIFFAFDPQRVAILLVGGDKAGKTKRFYKRMISVADQVYDSHLHRQAYGRHAMEAKRDEGRRQKKEEEQKVRRSQQ
jgi:hypothetical protein